jgi:hypothetical protein
LSEEENVSMDMLKKAEDLIWSGRRRAAARVLEEAAACLRRRLQRLPAWVVEGALVQWVGEGEHTVYRVTNVDRGGRGSPWSFSGEQVDDARYKLRFHQQAGRRNWRKYAGLVGQGG